MASINIDFNVFYDKFKNNSSTHASFMTKISDEVFEIFKVQQNRIWDMEKSFDLDMMVTNLKKLKLKNYTVKKTDEILLIFNEKIVLKFYPNGVLVPEIIGDSRREWFADLNYTFINLRPMLGLPVEVAERYIAMPSGIICPNSIDVIYDFIAHDAPIEAIDLMLQECMYGAESS